MKKRSDFTMTFTSLQSPQKIMRCLSRISLAGLLLLAASTPAFAQTPQSALCDENGCAPAIALTQFHGREAWRLTDGKTEALIVPSLARVMSFKRVGGQEWLWSAPDHAAKVPDWNGWLNWGGDKTWLSPADNWGAMGGKDRWPPLAEWEKDFRYEVQSGGKLKIWGAASPVTGLRVSRVFYFDENGDFVIEQTASRAPKSQTSGSLRAGLWSVTQINTVGLDAVFVPRAPQSAYENGYRLMISRGTAPTETVLPGLLKVTPAQAGAYKIGTDAPRASIAAVRGDLALVQKTRYLEGEYPDGDTPASGTSVQLYMTGDPKLTYQEMELLSPLLTFHPGTRWTHTVRWSLHPLPSSNVNDDAVYAEIDRLLN